MFSPCEGFLTKILSYMMPILADKSLSLQIIYSDRGRAKAGHLQEKFLEFFFSPSNILTNLSKLSRKMMKTTEKM